MSAVPLQVLALAVLASSPGPPAARAPPAPSAPEDGPGGGEILLPDCPGGARSGGAGPLATCPLLDAIDERGPAVEPPRSDFPGWLGQVTGWWGGAPDRDATRDRHGFVVAPFVASSPLIGLGFGVAAAGTLQLGDDRSTRASKYATNVLVTTNSQFSVPLRTDVTLPGGDWNLVGLLRWSRFPVPTWGLGGNTPDSARSVVDSSSLRLHQAVNRRFVGDLFVGAGLYLDAYWGIHDEGTSSGTPSAFSSYPYGTGQTSFSFGPGVSVLWDSRDSAVNATRGVYTSLTYAYVPTWLGSATTWHSVYLDVRGYLPLWRRLVVAGWSYAWLAFGDVPYLQLPAIGSDPDARSGRGYIEGRHVGKSLLYGEVELRYGVWEWLGLVAGVNIHSAGQPGVTGIFPDEPRFAYWYPAVSTGVRISMVRQSRSNLCLDAAFGRGGHGFYVNFSEAF